MTYKSKYSWMLSSKVCLDEMSSSSIQSSVLVIESRKKRELNIPFKQYWSLLSSYLLPQRSRILWLTILLFSSVGLNLVNPQILKVFIDTAVAHGSIQTLTWLAIAFMGVALLYQVLIIMTTYVSEKIRWMATNNLRVDLAAHCLELDMSFHTMHTPGEMIERIDGDIDVLSNFFSQFIISLLGSILLLGGVLVILFGEDWRVGLFTTIFAGCVLCVLRYGRSKIGALWLEERSASAALYGFLEERLFGLVDIHSSGAQGHVMRLYYQFGRQLFKKSTRAYIWGGSVLTPVIGGFFLVATIITLTFGAYLVTINTMTIGTLYLFFSYIQLLRNPIEQITLQIQDLQKADASIARIREILQMTSSIPDGPGVTFSDEAPTVEFHHVSFGYTREALVLEDLSFCVRPGKVLGLLGRTGSGKTTLARLLFRLYDPGEGAIFVNDRDIREARLLDLHKYIGVVTQEVQLFQATLRENLTFFDTSIADEHIIKILYELGLSRWYETLPDGLDTELTLGRHGLSSGEEQLIAFARVFLKNPRLVILDEASSRLDPATERLIEHAIDMLLHERTAIIIAHHLASIQRADTILILESGRVCEYGERRQLASDPESYFAQLLRTGMEELFA